MLYEVAKRLQQRKTCFIKDSGTEFAQIIIRLGLVHVRESKNVLQAVQTNQTLFIKLGNKRNVLGCLQKSNFVKHRSTS